MRGRRTLGKHYSHSFIPLNFFFLMIRGFDICKNNLTLNIRMELIIAGVNMAINFSDLALENHQGMTITFVTPCT